MEAVVLCVVPPAAGMCHRRCGGRGQPQPAQLAVHGCAALALLELQRPQPVANPGIELREDSRRLRLLEVLLPTRQLRAQIRDHRPDATAPVASADFTHPPFQRGASALGFATLRQAQGRLSPVIGRGRRAAPGERRVEFDPLAIPMTDRGEYDVPGRAGEIGPVAAAER